MALIGYEGFDYWSTTPATDFLVVPFSTGFGGTSGGIWTLNGASWTKVAGALAGSGVKSAGNQQANLSFTTNYTTLIFGMRYTTSGSFAAINDILAFLDTTATAQCGLSINTSGKLIVWRGTNATVLATGTTVLTTSTTYFIEMSATINNTTGAFTVNLNGTQELTATGQNTRQSANNFTNGVQLRITTTNPVYDDLYVCDTTGSAPTNTFLGNAQTQTLFATGTNSAAFTPNASTNLSQIQETGFDGDTTYNISTASGTIDKFTHGPMTNNPTTIFAVDVCAYMRKDDVTQRSARTKLSSGVTSQDGATVNPIPGSYRSIRDSYVTDPNTGVAWLGPAANATLIGYEQV